MQNVHCTCGLRMLCSLIGLIDTSQQNFFNFAFVDLGNIFTLGCFMMAPRPYAEPQSVGNYLIVSKNVYLLKVPHACIESLKLSAFWYRLRSGSNVQRLHDSTTNIPSLPIILTYLTNTINESLHTVGYNLDNSYGVMSVDR